MIKATSPPAHLRPDANKMLSSTTIASAVVLGLLAFIVALAITGLVVFAPAQLWSSAVLPLHNEASHTLTDLSFVPPTPQPSIRILTPSPSRYSWGTIASNDTRNNPFLGSLPPGCEGGRTTSVVALRAPAPAPDAPAPDAPAADAPAAGAPAGDMPALAAPSKADEDSRACSVASGAEDVLQGLGWCDATYKHAM